MKCLYTRGVPGDFEGKCVIWTFIQIYHFLAGVQKIVLRTINMCATEKYWWLNEWKGKHAIVFHRIQKTFDCKMHHYFMYH